MEASGWRKPTNLPGYASLTADDHRPKFAMVIIHYLDAEAVNDLIDRAHHWKHPPSKVIVVDNSGEYAFTRNCPTPDVIRSQVNVGYGAAANAGVALAAAAGFTLALIATQDVDLSPKCTDVLCSHFAKDCDLAVSLPLVTYRDRPDIIFSAGGRLTRFGRTLHIAQGDPASLYEHADPRLVDWGDGACLMLDISAFNDVGGFDKQFFLYVEEVDLQLRLRLAGFKVLLDPEAIASQTPGNYTLYLKHRNLIYFTRKHNQTLKLWPWPVGWVKDSARMIAKGRLEQPLWGLRGMVDAMRGRMGPPPPTLFSDGAGLRVTQ